MRFTLQVEKTSLNYYLMRSAFTVFGIPEYKFPFFLNQKRSVAIEHSATLRKRCGFPVAG